MKPPIMIFSALLAIASAACTPEPKTELAQTEVKVMGQAPPGDVPELLAPGLVSTSNLEGLAAFSPDLKELYFIRQETGSRPGYVVLQNKSDRLETAPVETTDGLGEVFISTDGQTMYLGNEYRTRTPDGWSEKQSLGSALEQYPIMRLTASDAGTYVFDEQDEFGKLRYSRVIDGVREAPQTFNDNINSGTFTSHPFIAPDESYLIFDSQRDGGFGSSDLYISFSEEDGSWGPAMNLGDTINTEFDDIFGSVTADGRYFVFQTINLDEPRSDIFWVDAAFIKSLRQSR